MQGFVVNKIGRFYKPWFFKYIESFLETGQKEELIPLQDYYFRHENSIFWQIRVIIKIHLITIMYYKVLTVFVLKAVISPLNLQL